MNPEIIAAIIGGGATLMAAIIGAVVRMRTAGRRPQPPAPSARGKVVLPPRPKDQLRREQPASAADPKPAAAEPRTRSLPLVPTPDLYKGLAGEELITRFWADAQIELKPDDVFFYGEEE
jgi:hypothetical protein